MVSRKFFCIILNVHPKEIPWFIQQVCTSFFHKFVKVLSFGVVMCHCNYYFPQHFLWNNHVIFRAIQEWIKKFSSVSNNVITVTVYLEQKTRLAERWLIYIRFTPIDENIWNLEDNDQNISAPIQLMEHISQKSQKYYFRIKWHTSCWVWEIVE